MAQQQMSLFGGPSPADLLRQQQMEDQALAMRQAQLGPGQGLMYQAASAGQRAGRSLAGLFGIEDPAMVESKKMEQIKQLVKQNWDGEDPLEAFKLTAKYAADAGLMNQAMSAAMQVKAMEADRLKTELGKRKTEADIGLVGAQTESVKKTSERATAQEARAAEEFDYSKSQRALDEAIKEVNLTAARKSNEAKQVQYDAAKLALDKAKVEFEAMPSGFYKRQYELKLKKLEADIDAAKALATYRERERTPDRKRKMAEIPVRDDIGTVIGKKILYSDGTIETVYGNTPPSTEDTASQTAKSLVPGSNITMEQLIAERNRRKQQPGAK
jgi:hypothetical protein